MSMTATDEFGKTDTIVQQLTGFVAASVNKARSMLEFERGLLDRLLQLGRHLTDQFLQAQPNGDQGKMTKFEDTTVHRSDKPVIRKLRTIFGQHTFEAYVYRVQRNEKSATALRPVDQRLGLGPERYSPLLQEFSMMLCVEQAFHQSRDTFEAIFRQRLSVDTLERISRRMGTEAGEFINALPAPDSTEEGEFLVATADGKGVPMKRADAEKLRACDPRPDRPGNRRSAIVAAVYSVDPHVRTPEQILASLFRSETAGTETAGAVTTVRPAPCHKRYSAWFSQPLPDLEEAATGTQLAMQWTSRQVDDRQSSGQKLIRIMDGQHSLWDCAAASLGGVDSETDVVEVLDLLHVCGYVWNAAKALFSKRPEQERFVKQKLMALLRGEVKSVIRSLRYLATSHGLIGDKLKELQTACGYFESHQHRMCYDTYLSAGYPIATGVIEGACRHIVKDRMERSGMRWTQDGAQNLLHLRCLKASGLWNQFQKQRSNTLNA